MLTGRQAFVDALRGLLQQTLAEGARELWWADADFADWPLNEAALVEALTQWARPHHRVHLIAHHYDEMPRRHPRFVRWRRDFNHLVDAWCAEDLEPAAHPTLCVGGHRSIELLDREHWRARVSEEPADARLACERLDVILQRAAPGFAATTLGL